MAGTNSEPPALSAIILGYRAGKNLEPLVRNFHAHLVREGVNFELVLVANYEPGDETDPTPQVAAALAKNLSQTTALAEEKRGGMGWDMRAGLRAASGRFVVVLDGDGQNPAEDILRAFDLHQRTGADLVIGHRTVRGDGPVRKLISTVYNGLFLIMFGTWGLSDINGKPKGVDRSGLQLMQLEADDWFIDAEIVLEARRLSLRIEKLPVRFLENEHRASFVDWRTIGEFLRNMVRRRFGRASR